ncbi:MAG: DNA topoisomerase VI subunit B [Nanoarchaeota archaeon]
MAKSKNQPKLELIKAEELAQQQREISVAAFFEKNRHLLGFDSPVKALATAVKEMVDNSLDACEEMHVLPNIIVIIKESGENRYIVSVEDNGPGIVKEQIPRVFAKLLYGSKFYRFFQSRGQQGLGVSASILYGQLTTGKPAKITSRISPKKPTHYYELHIDIAKNEPEIVVDKEIEWIKDHGTKVEIELEGKYQKGRLSVDEYLKQAAIANPHLNLVYIDPLKEKVEFKRVTNELPEEPKEIKPHPYGIELGVLIRMLRNTESRNLRSFLTNEFSRVSNAVADEIINKTGLKPDLKPKEISTQDADKIFRVIQQVKIMLPPTDCLSPIGEDLLLKGLKKEINAEFYAAISRSPAVYRGIPFEIEVAIAYGGSSFQQDELVRVIRFANRVPLIYQQSACAITRSILNTDWKNYGLQQSKGALPIGPALITVHIASVWVPFTSESKEAIAHYDEIIKEIKLALQECGRKLQTYIRKTVRVKEAKERISLFEKYIPEVANSLSILTGKKKELIVISLNKMLKKGLPELIAQANGENQNGKAKE